MCLFKDIGLKILLAAVFVKKKKRKKRKQFRCLSTRKCLNNLWYLHTLKFFAAIKMNKSALHVPIGKCLKNALLNEKRCRIVRRGWDDLCMLPVLGEAENISGMIHKKLIIVLASRVRNCMATSKQGRKDSLFITHLLNFRPYVSTMYIWSTHICFYTHMRSLGRGYLKVATVSSSMEGPWRLEDLVRET